jgi:hypothetical protein
MNTSRLPLRPAEFCRLALNALAAAEGRRKRRKRDQTPDAIGQSLKRALYERAVADDPEPDGFEAWLLTRVFAAPAGGPVRAVAAEVLDEYRLAAADGSFGDWLRAGAPSADAEAELGARHHRDTGQIHSMQTWDPTCDRGPAGWATRRGFTRAARRWGRRGGHVVASPVRVPRAPRRERAAASQ